MRKIVVSDYIVEGNTYEVKRSLIVVLFHPDRKLDAFDTLKAQKIAQKIEAAPESVLLEESEYEQLLEGIKVTRGFTRNDVELIERVLNAPEVNLDPSA